MGIRFDEIAVGDYFDFNGNRWFKRSSRTADLISFNRWFYFGSGDIVSKV